MIERLNSRVDRSSSYSANTHRLTLRSVLYFVTLTAVAVFVAKQWIKHSRTSKLLLKSELILPEIDKIFRAPEFEKRTSRVYRSKSCFRLEVQYETDVEYPVEFVLQMNQRLLGFCQEFATCRVLATKEEGSELEYQSGIFRGVCLMKVTSSPLGVEDSDPPLEFGSLDVKSNLMRITIEIVEL